MSHVYRHFSVGTVIRSHGEFLRRKGREADEGNRIQTKDHVDFKGSGYITDFQSSGESQCLILPMLCHDISESAP